MNSQQDEFAPAIDRLLADIQQRENEIAERKRMVNALCEWGDRPPMFHDIEAERQSVTAIKGDQFHGKPLQTVVKDYLLLRGDSSKGGLGAASVNEIYEALIAGGYQFDAKDADNAKRGLRISLTKNSATFHMLPNKRYGLRVWYPKASRTSNATDANEDAQPEPRESAQDTVDDPELDQQPETQTADDAETSTAA